MHCVGFFPPEASAVNQTLTWEETEQTSDPLYLGKQYAWPHAPV